MTTDTTPDTPRTKALERLDDAIEAVIFANNAMPPTGARYTVKAERRLAEAVIELDAARAALAASPATGEGLGEFSFSAFLIERGQPEGHTPPIYAKDWRRNDAGEVEPVWTDDPWSAYRADREEVEKVIGLWNAAPARAVEHGFTCDHLGASCYSCRQTFARLAATTLDLHPEEEAG